MSGDIKSSQTWWYQQETVSTSTRLHMCKDTLPMLWRSLRDMGCSHQHCLISTGIRSPSSLGTESHREPQLYSSLSPCKATKMTQQCLHQLIFVPLSASKFSAPSLWPGPTPEAQPQVWICRPAPRQPLLVLSAVPKSSSLQSEPTMSFPQRRPFSFNLYPFNLSLQYLLSTPSSDPAGLVCSPCRKPSTPPLLPARPTWKSCFRATQHGSWGHCSVCSGVSDSQGRDLSYSS